MFSGECFGITNHLFGFEESSRVGICVFSASIHVGVMCSGAAMCFAGNFYMLNIYTENGIVDQWFCVKLRYLYVHSICVMACAVYVEVVWCGGLWAS